MKKLCKQWILLFATVAAISMLLSGCNLTSTEQPPYSTIPPGGSTGSADTVRVTYSYGETGNVQLSSNNVTLKVGQKLILEPASGMSGRTRFVSSGQGYIGDMLRQETDQNPSTQVVFTAVKPGSGKLQVIPNMTETERATDLLITVQ